MVEELNKGVLVIILVGLVFLVMATMAFINDKYSVAITTNITSTTETVLSEDSQTLNHTPRSLTATALNQTWLEFDGVNDFIKTDINSNIDFQTNFSFSLWFKNEGASTSGNQFLVSKSDDDSGTNGFILYYDFNQNRIESLINQGSTSVSGGIGSLTQDQWYHLVGNFAENGDITLYVNKSGGSTVNSDDLKNITTSQNLTFGNRGDATNRAFNGSIKNLHFFNTTLNQNQIDEIYFQELNLLNNKNKGVPVIYFHQIGNGDSTDPSIDGFTDMLSYINESGFTTITARDYKNWIDNSYNLPKKPIILMFDDAAKSVYTNATPIMDSFDFIGVLPIPTGKPDVLGGTMTWIEINELYVKGWEMAAHSHYHDNFVTEMTYNDWVGNFSVPKQDIIENVGVTPITHIYPYNSRNDSTDLVCKDYFELCFGEAEIINSSLSKILNIYKNSNLTGNNELLRMEVKNSSITTFDDFKNAIDIYQEELLNYKLKENQGTTAYDSSGNGNNGTISGATWDNDGINNTLISGVDYTVSGNTFTIENEQYAWSQITAAYTFATDTIAQSILGDANTNIEDNTSIAGLIMTISLIAIVITILVGVFVSVRSRRI